MWHNHNSSEPTSFHWMNWTFLQYSVLFHYTNVQCMYSMTRSCMQLKIKLLGTYHWTNSLFVWKLCEQPCIMYTGVSHTIVGRVCTAWKRSSDRCIECWVLWEVLKTLPVDFNPGFTVSVLATAFSSREVKGVTWYSFGVKTTIFLVVLVRHEHYYQLWAGYHVFEISKAVVIICFELLLPSTVVLSNILPQIYNTCMCPISVIMWCCLE